MITLNEDQGRALKEIMSAQKQGNGHYLLTGYAGSGKTTLMGHLVRELKDKKLDVVVTAPTHKAVNVLSQKINGIVPCITIHRLLGLRPKPVNGKTVLERVKGAGSVQSDVVIIDECSMIGSDLMGWIKRLLPHRFVVFVGDPAQLPPVGEEKSESFSIQRHSHLDEIVRQGKGNPILDIAHIIRKHQGNPVTYGWCRDLRNGKQGVFVKNNAENWLKQSFTSMDFAQNNDLYRYLCWTNQRVNEINNIVRYWIYGGTTPTPFMPGERVIMRSPIIYSNEIVISTNDEVEILEIKVGHFSYTFKSHFNVDVWDTTIPVWECLVKTYDEREIKVYLPIDQIDVDVVNERLVKEATINKDRWKDKADFNNSLAKMQAIYAMTVHTSQGSTFGKVFVDIADIARRGRSNPLETWQLLYVAATRPTDALILTGVRQ